MFAGIKSGQGKKRTQVVALDLGSRTTKAVHIQRKGPGFELLNYAFVEAPVVDKLLTSDMMAAHFKEVLGALGSKARHAVAAVGAMDSVLRTAELPMVPLSDMRLMLKLNSKNYLQQEYQDHFFDCHIRPPSTTGAEPGKPPAKAQVWVAGARRQFLDLLQESGRGAAISLEMVMPSGVCLANALELAEPNVFAQEAVALVDVGFKSSSISIIHNGELALWRSCAIGSEKITRGLAESMGVTEAEAEQIKLGLPDQVQQDLQTLLMPLGRELRASVDFFEHQQDKTVTQILMSGGSVKSPFIVETLQSELMVPCRLWNPAGSLELSLPAVQLGGLEQAQTQLGVAIGAAMAAF